MENNINPANQPTQQATFFAFDAPKGQSAYIKVIGVGGGGGNAVNHMYKQGIEGVDFIVCNTDMKALNASPVPNKIPLGDLGLGAGGKPERARKAAEGRADDIREVLSHNTQMLFITAGMGGGTGTGAAPVIAELAKGIDLQNDENEKILVVAIVTRPFGFEGADRCAQAEAGIEELSKYVDSIIVINNDKLRSFGNLTKSNAFAMADDILLTAAKGIAEIITKEGSVNRDFQDIKSVMENSGTALMGTGCGKGENRAHDAIVAATTSVLLDDSDINGAKNVLLYFSYSHDHEMTIDEMTEVTDYVTQITGGKAKVLWGDSFDDSLGEELKVILIATGFEKNNVVPEKPTVYELPKDEPKVVPSAPQPLMDVYKEMEIIHKSQAEEKHEEKKQSVSEVEVAVINHVKNIIHLDDEPVSVVQPVNPAYVQPEVKRDIMVEDIRLITTEPEVAVLPDPASASTPVSETPARSAFENSNDVQLAAERAERIRKIHEMLRGTPTSAELVHRMSTQEITGEELYEGNHSAIREAASFTIRQDGSMARNGWLDEQPD